MAWLWQGSDEPHSVPEWAYFYIRDNLNVMVVNALCVEQINYIGNALVTLIRIFDPMSVPDDIKIADFASLDQAPELIQFEGYREAQSGEVHIVKGPAIRKRIRPQHAP